MTTVEDPQHEHRTTDICRRLTMLIVDQLGFEVGSDSRGVFTLDVPESIRESVGNRTTVEFTFDRQRVDSNDDEPLEFVTPDGHLFNWLLDQFGQLNRPLYADPREQITQVHELTHRLFDAYQVEGGQVQLAGCAMTDRLFVRSTFRRPHSADADDERLIDVFLDEELSVVEPGVVESLGLNDVAGLAKPHALVDDARLDAYQSDAAKQVAADAQLIATTLVWSKYCHGKLRFTIGDATAELPFEGWAETLKAPPFVCPVTGASSFHVVATDEDVITVAEAVETCAVSGTKMFADGLETCTVSGQKALADHFIDCPVTHSRLLRTELVICPACTQAVSPRCIANEQCQVCWPLPATDKDDPRMARILGEYPGLDRWRNWHLKETDDWYLLEARGLIRRLLVVVATDTLEALHLAAGTRLGRRWTPIDRVRYEEFLK
ncbi:MAG: hypothetical protein MI757_17500 [Pirellulales bacterium]|nr:hypothetical protein [Pirellulales bacterium]